MTEAGKPKDIVAAFEQTATALQQFGIERIRVEGISAGCSSPSFGGHSAPTAIRTLTEQEFMREFVFQLRPCVIVDAIEEWPARSKWRDDRYLFNLDAHLPAVESDPDENEGGNEEETDGEVFLQREEGLHEKRVTVALTPNGRADAVTHVFYDPSDVPVRLHEATFGSEARKHMVSLPEEDKELRLDSMDNGLIGEKMFLAAAEVKVTLPELYHLLHGNAVDSRLPPTHIDMRKYASEDKSDLFTVAYAQLQNNCLNTQYTFLHQDIKPNVEEFGNRVFGQSKPEAANVWFGTKESVSSMHQDWVENLYAVVRGVKEFLLIPPWEGFFIPKPDIPSGGFILDEERSDREGLSFKFRPYPKKDGSVMPWMDFDVTPEFVENSTEEEVLVALNKAIDECYQQTCKRTPEAARFPPRKTTKLHPIVAHVYPGETLYLPAMWLHRVSQRGDDKDIAARAHFRKGPEGSASGTNSKPPLPLIAAVNYWYDMSFENPAVVMLREFGVLL